MNEECQYLESLGTAANLSELVIDFRPCRYVTAERLGESISYQGRRLLGQKI